MPVAYVGISVPVSFDQHDDKSFYVLFPRVAYSFIFPFTNLHQNHMQNFYVEQGQPGVERTFNTKNTSSLYSNFKSVMKRNHACKANIEPMIYT